MRRVVCGHGVWIRGGVDGIGFVPWGPLGQGFLPGTLSANAQSTFDPKNDLRATFPRVSPMVMQNNQPMIDFLKTFGAKKAATPAQVALAYLMAQVVDRSDCRHDQPRSSAREHRRDHRPTDAR